MKLYVLRHGETAMNSRNEVCGRTDDVLTPHGEEQAAAAAAKLAALSDGDAVDAVFVSPLARAQKTAEIAVNAIARASGKTPPVYTDSRLIEQDYGAFEGTDHRLPGFLESKLQFASAAGGRETVLRLAHRVYSLIEEIKNNGAFSGKNVLFVTHGGVSRVVRTYFESMTNDEFAAWRALNCQIDCYEVR